MLDDWDRCFPNCEPLGYQLRVAFARRSATRRRRWVRFHSLPESKRYPENEAEYAELLARHNAVLGELVHPGERVVLVTTGYSDSPAPVRSYPEVVAFDPGATPWRTIAMHRAGAEFEDPNYWHLFTSMREWHPGEFDPLVRLVAEDRVANVLIASLDCQWVLHPYDGGMDVIAASPEDRGRLRRRYAAWRSAHPSGL
jgi:hypothetical protein